MAPRMRRAMACWLRLVDTARRRGPGRRRLAPGRPTGAAGWTAGDEPNGNGAPVSKDGELPRGTLPTALSDDGTGMSLEETAAPASPAGAATDDPDPKVRLSPPAGRNCTENGAWLSG